MNNTEKLQGFLEDAYDRYCKWVDSENKKGRDDANNLRRKRKLVDLWCDSKLSQEEFINKIKTDKEFAERWGLKIEERELSLQERINLAEQTTEIIPGFDSHFVSDDEVHKVIDT